MLACDGVRRFYLLTEKRALRLPTPPQMRNKGNFVVSLRRARAVSFGSPKSRRVHISNRISRPAVSLPRARTVFLNTQGCMARKVCLEQMC